MVGKEGAAMSDRPDLDEAINILQSGGFNISGGKYAPPGVQPEWVRKLEELWTTGTAASPQPRTRKKGGDDE